MECQAADLKADFLYGTIDASSLLAAARSNALEEDRMSSAPIHRSEKHKAPSRKVNVPALVGLCLIGGIPLLFYGLVLLLIFGG